MLGFYLRERQTEKTFMRKEEIRQRIAHTDTFIVGSSMNGLGMEFSDLDLTIEQKLEARDSMRKQRRPKEILKVLKKFIMQDFETDVAIISSGNDSYLKFIDESGIAVKVFVNRSNSVGSSKLLKSYTRLDRRVAPLIVVVKCWGRSSGLSCTKDLLNGYSLSLMAIHFLQSGCHPAVLPSLQILAPAAFNNFEFPFIDDEPPNFISENDESIGKLLLELFEFYSYRFRFAEDIISVREGQPIPKHECENDPNAEFKT
ncbi:Poly(A) RNA polymerase gld-2-like protein [Leptotrombidium deliense]|uniref:Poly(A) RNA polymerase gld-2-like protein n=1 Tax=Leptotrombidium deliense TaxID=299467 RepID=A0A443SSK9_9ACAR|nr:Poly(A) RNA polymerase gld-2-like protein [Leptotrombidium deliense]